MENELSRSVGKKWRENRGVKIRHKKIRKGTETGVQKIDDKGTVNSLIFQGIKTHI